MARWMGVDYGDKRIGLAQVDEDLKICVPWQNYTRRSPDVDSDYFRAIIRAEGITKAVIGLPVRTTGKEGEKAKAARKFGAWLRGVTGLDVYFWDERFTTAEADALLANTKLPKKKRKARRDMIAAQLMLQDFVDAGFPRTFKPDPLDDVLTAGRF